MVTRAGERGRLRGCAPIIVATTLALADTAEASPTEPGELVNPLESAATCQTCHQFANPPERADEPLVAPFAWRGSMMGNSARDPVFWAGVAVAAQDAPGETTLCVRCHSPSAFLDGRGDATAVDELAAEDLFGVDCETCHRSIDDGETPAGNANYVIDDVAVDGQVPKRGPWSYEGGSAPPHATSDDDAFVASSRLCGTCHDVTTPRERVDDDGAPTGALFNEQRTYSEWLGSDFAAAGDEHRDCQDCHMPALADVAGCDSFTVAGLTHATGGRRHSLAGANQATLAVLAALYGSEGTGDTPDLYFEEAIAASQELLATAATLEIEAPELVDLQAGLTLPIRVVNESGHKLPTGYSEGREMWLELRVRYGDELIYASGRWDADSQTIEQDAQRRSYEAVAERWSDGSRFHLLRNDHWLRDDRIPPRGLAPDPQTDPVGDRYALVDGAWQHWDAFEYAFAPTEVADATPNDGGDDLAVIELRLLYLVNSAEYLDFLADENATNEAGTSAQAAFDALGGAAPVVVAERSVSVPLRGLAGQPDEDETGDSSPESDSSDTADAAADDSADGCGCSSAGGRSAAPLLVLVTLLGRRRRRAYCGAAR